MCVMLQGEPPRANGTVARIMADTEQMSQPTLLDELASLDPQARREVATALRELSETIGAVCGVCCTVQASPTSSGCGLVTAV